MISNWTTSGVEGEVDQQHHHQQQNGLPIEGGGVLREGTPTSGSYSSSEDDDDLGEWVMTSSGTASGRRFDSIEDVSHAIDACKKAILQTDENTESRKDKVMQLIKLQICQADLKDRRSSNGVNGVNGSIAAASAASNFESRGHRFVTYQSATVPIPGVTDGTNKRVYCQQCGYGIWVHLQGSHHCRDCGFSVHTACVEGIMRGCVAQKVKVQPDFIMDICPEKSLPSLKYRCVECDVKLTSVSGSGAAAAADQSSSSNARTVPRLCDYTGLYFCGSCHWNASSATPARIVRNWDFGERPVSQATKQYLRLMIRKPVINVRAENPKLFAVIPELAHVDHLRHNIMLMKKYLVVCRIAAEAKILLHLVARQHFVDGPDLYSLQDLLDIRSGALIKFLDRVVAEFTGHIFNCKLCLAKGFICEICDSTSSRSPPSNSCLSTSAASTASSTAKNCGLEEVTFPFSDDAKTCPDCDGVFHKFCFKQVTECPKCKRLYQRERTFSK